jgi:GcrA cell cycle regulator
MTTWNERAIEYLRANWGTATARQIAEELGCTRSAVIGKAHRLGLKDLGNPVGKPHFKAEPVERAPYQRRDENGKPKVAPLKVASFPSLKQGVSQQALSGTAVAGARRRAERETQGALSGQLQLVPAVPVESLPLFESLDTRASGSVPSDTVPDDGPRALAALSDLGCKWPVNKAATRDGHLFCNAQRVGGKPYCADHCAKAYAGYSAPAPAVDLGGMANWSVGARRQA